MSKICALVYNIVIEFMTAVTNSYSSQCDPLRGFCRETAFKETSQEDTRVILEAGIAIK